MSGVSIGITTRNWLTFAARNGWDDRTMILEIQNLIETGLNRYDKVVLLLEQMDDMDQINTWLASALKGLEQHKKFNNVYLSSCLCLENIKQWLPQVINNNEDSEKVGLLSQPDTVTIPLLIIKKTKRHGIQFSGVVARTFYALTSVLDSGRVDRVGLSGFRYGHVAELQRRLKTKGYPGLSAIQVDFSVLNRRAETTGLLLYCLRQRITVLASSPIPSDLVNLMLPLRSSPGNPYTPSTAEIHQMLSDAKYNIKKTKLQLHFTPDTSSVELNNKNSLLALALRAVADSRNLPWESIALNYIFEKGLIPLIENVQVSKQLNQAVGWSLSQRETIGLDRVSQTLMSFQETPKNCLIFPTIFTSPFKYLKSQFQKKVSSEDIKINHPTKDADIIINVANPSSPIPSKPLNINLSDIIPKSSPIDLITNLSSPRHDITSPLPNLSPRINIILSPRMSNPGQQLSFTIRGSPQDALAWETNLDIQIIPQNTRTMITAGSSVSNLNQSLQNLMPPSLETLSLKDILFDENLEPITESLNESIDVSTWKPILRQSITVSIPDYKTDSIPNDDSLLLTSNHPSIKTTSDISNQDTSSDSVFESAQDSLPTQDTSSVNPTQESNYFEFPRYYTSSSSLYPPTSTNVSASRSLIFKLDLE